MKNQEFRQGDAVTRRDSNESDLHQKLSDPMGPRTTLFKRKKKEQYIIRILFLLLALRLKYYYNSRVYHLYF